MKIAGHLEFNFNDERHIFRTLTPHDVDMSYVSALRAERTFIENRSDDITMESQRKYVNNILGSANDTICGLFSETKLIGTAGIQNLASDKSQNRKIRLAVGNTINSSLGAFLCDNSMKGKGFGKILVWASCYFSYCRLGVTLFEVSVLKHNIPSFKAFLSCGFKISEESAIGANLRLKVDEELAIPENVKRQVVIEENY